MTTRDDLLAACAETPSNWHQLLVTADWMAENGDERWERALRWMVREQKQPLPPKYEGRGYWLWTCYGGLCGPVFQCGTDHALPKILRERFGFWEWRGYESWVAAVDALVRALEQGDVVCTGDPLKAEPVEYWGRYDQGVGHSY